MTIELKPCPFCGGQDLFIERLDYSSAFVQCDSEVSPGCACMARGPVGGQDDDGEDVPGAESAAREWNRRADHQTVTQMQARVAELEGALASEREACAVVCDEMAEHWAAYKDSALLNGDVDLSNAASGEPRAARAIAALIRGRE